MNYKLQEVKAVLPRVVSAIVCKLPLFRAVYQKDHILEAIYPFITACQGEAACIYFQQAMR